MKYILKTIDTEIKIDEEEYTLIASNINSKPFIAIKRLGLLVKTNAIMEIYPEHSADVLSKKKDQQYGILHDGSTAKRHFGQWVADTDFVPDDKGGVEPVRLSKEYYPEATLDCLATREEFKQIRETGADYYEFLGIGDRAKRLGTKNNNLIPLNDCNNK